MSLSSVLILEQDENLVNIFSTIITRRGLDKSYNITKESSVDEALKTIRKQQFDIVLLDYNFVGKEGVRLLSEIRDYSPDARCILITDKVEDKELSEKVKNGGVSLMNKSFQDNELLKMIQDIFPSNDGYSDTMAGVYEELDSSPFGSVLIDDDYTVIYSNKQFKTLYGETVGQKCFRVMGAGNSPCTGCLIPAVFRDRISKTLVRDLETSSEGLKETIEPSFKKDGSLRGYTLTFSDAGSDEIMPEPFLQQLTTIKDIEEQGIVTFALDKKSRIVSGDENFLKVCEMEEEELVGKPITAFLHSYLVEYLVKEEKSFVDFARTVSSRQINIDFLSSKTKKRKTLICEFRFNHSVEGQNWDLFVMARDSRREKLLNQLIEFMKESSSQLLSGNFDMFLTLNEDKKIQSINPSFLKRLECRKSDIVDKHIAHILADVKDQESLDKAFEQTAAMNNVFNLRVDLKLKDKFIPTLVNVRAIRDRYNNEIGYALVMRDIQKDLMMEATLPRIERMQALGELAATTAHQINNYMDGIFKGISLLEMDIMMSPALGGESKKEMNSHINMIRERAARLSSLTKHLTNYARNQNAPVISLGSINSVIKDVEELVRDKIRSRVAEIEVSLADNIPALYFSPIHLEQAVMNMVMNAVDALPEKDGKIEITTYLSGSWACIEIKDNGCGIPEHIRPDIFTAFKTTKPAGVGTGLGLKLAKDVVNSLNGRIILETEVGKGTAFTIRLPIRKAGG